MLKNLTIKNYALIAHADLEFESGLNILTGETGAGKSILLGALGTILGDRVDTGVLRTGEKKAVIEGCFDIGELPHLADMLSENDFVLDGCELILRREIADNGRTRAFINDTPAQVNMLQAVGDALVDLHGQHEHQSLFRESRHLDFLDGFANLESEVEAVSDYYRRIKTLRAKMKTVMHRQRESNQRQEYLSFQLEELKKAGIEPGEEKKLLDEEKRLRHSESRFELSRNLREILYEAKDSVYDQLNIAISKIAEITEFDDSLEKCKEDCESAKLIVEELAKTFQSYNSAIEFQPERLEEIQIRLSELAGLRKKYQKTIEELSQYKENLVLELESLQNAKRDFGELQQELDRQKNEFGRICFELSCRRKEASEELKRQVPEVLEYLGMPGSRFKVNLEYQKDPEGDAFLDGEFYLAAASGIDFAKFELSANAGEILRPLKKVASGGEISRIMLALKSILAKKGQIPVLIFDEIDNGVSGRTARAVGRKLKELSTSHQVICITHLPQIASMAEHHYVVEKQQVAGRVESNIRKVPAAEREQVIAKLLAGETISEAHLSSARELLQGVDLKLTDG